MYFLPFWADKALFFLLKRNSFMGRLDRDDSSLLVKLHPVGTNLTVYSRSLFGTDKVLVDTMLPRKP